MRSIQQLALLALAAIVIASGLATTSRVCCLVEDEDDVCCEGDASALPQLAGPDCCDDDTVGQAAVRDLGTFAKLAIEHERAPNVVIVTSAPQAGRVAGSLAPRGVRRVLAPPVPIARILATSRLLI